MSARLSSSYCHVRKLHEGKKCVVGRHIFHLGFFFVIHLFPFVRFGSVGLNGARHFCCGLVS